MREGVAVLATGQADHDAIAVFDEAEVGDASAHLMSELALYGVFSGHEPFIAAPRQAAMLLRGALFRLFGGGRAFLLLL